MVPGEIYDCFAHHLFGTHIILPPLARRIYLYRLYILLSPSVTLPSILYLCTAARHRHPVLVKTALQVPHTPTWHLPPLCHRYTFYFQSRLHQFLVPHLFRHRCQRHSPLPENDKTPHQRSVCGTRHHLHDPIHTYGTQQQHTDSQLLLQLRIFTEKSTMAQHLPTHYHLHHYYYGNHQQGVLCRRQHSAHRPLSHPHRHALLDRLAGQQSTTSAPCL